MVVIFGELLKKTLSIVIMKYTNRLKCEHCVREHTNHDMAVENQF